MAAFTGPMRAAGPDRVTHRAAMGSRIAEIGMRGWAEETMRDRLGSAAPDAQVAWWVELMARSDPAVVVVVGHRTGS